MLGEPKLGGNPKGNYEEQARVPQGSSGNRAGLASASSHRSYWKSKNPLRQSLVGEIYKCINGGGEGGSALPFIGADIE